MGAYISTTPNQLNNDTHVLLHHNIFQLMIKQLARVSAPAAWAFASTCVRARRLAAKWHNKTILMCLRFEYITKPCTRAIHYPNPVVLWRRLRARPDDIVHIHRTVKKHNLSCDLFAMWKYACMQQLWIVLDARRCVPHHALALWHIAVRIRPEYLKAASHYAVCRDAWSALSDSASRGRKCTSVGDDPIYNAMKQHIHIRNVREGVQIGSAIGSIIAGAIGYSCTNTSLREVAMFTAGAAIFTGIIAEIYIACTNKKFVPPSPIILP